MDFRQKDVWLPEIPPGVGHRRIHEKMMNDEFKARLFDSGLKIHHSVIRSAILNGSTSAAILPYSLR